MKYLSIFVNFFLFTVGFNLSIKYNNDSIKSLAEYDEFLNRIQQDPRLVEYLKIRDEICSVSTLHGPLIGPHRAVFGAHFVGFKFDEVGSDSYVTCIELINEVYSFLIRSDVRQIPDTDLALHRLDNFNEKGETAYTAIDKLPILERATVDEIKNPLNQFYALSCTLHGDAIKNDVETDEKFTSLDSKYKNVVKCKPTLDNPLTQPKLRFDIDDNANHPLEFRTFHGDSVQNFFLVTPNGQIKVVGTHNPGNNYFSVENLAYPPTRAFTDNLILNDALGRIYKGYLNAIYEQGKKHVGIPVGPQSFLFFSNPNIQLGNAIKVGNRDFNVVAVEHKEGMTIVHSDDTVNKIFKRNTKTNHKNIWDFYNSTEIEIKKEQNTMLVRVNNSPLFELNPNKNDIINYTILKFVLDR